MLVTMVTMCVLLYQDYFNTRLHSSRMRTARALTVSCVCRGGGVPAGGVTCRGGYLPGGVSVQGACLPGGELSPGGGLVGLPAGVGTCPGGGMSARGSAQGGTCQVLLPL